MLDLVDKWNSDKMHESIRVWVEIETLAKLIFSQNILDCLIKKLGKN